MKKRILFIINPIAGTQIRQFKEKFVHRYFKDDTNFSYQIVYTQYAGHALKIVQKTVANQTADIVAIAGGDGSINEIITPLLHSNIILAILPAGSGNGLAHHLKIPMDLRQSVALIKTGKVSPIDVGYAKNNIFGEHYFLSNFGIGYDAEVIHNYDKVKQRGFLTYLFFLIKAMLVLRPKPVHIQFDGFEQTLHPFVFTIANSSQYGYKIELVPEASISDGTLDALLLRDKNIIKTIRYAIFSIFRQYKQLKTVAEFPKSKQFNLYFSEKTKVQIDGEPFFASGNTTITVKQHALKIIAP